jgi:hypothetical protein
VCVILCTVFRLIVVLFCVMCIVCVLCLACVLCLIVVPLPPGENQVAVKINKNNNKIKKTLHNYRRENLKSYNFKEISIIPIPQDDATRCILLKPLVQGNHRLNQLTA